MDMKDVNFIHPTAIVEDGVIMGVGNYIGPFCLIKNGVSIGNNNRFEAYCSVGTPAEHKDYFTKSDYPTIIGNNNTIREYCTLNAGTNNNTVIGDFNIMLRGSHLGHDSIIENNVTLSCNSLVGGHSYIMNGVNMGLGSICHQYSVIGAFSMLGMGTIVTKKTPILPGNIYVGSPANFLKLNTIGLERNYINDDKLYELQIRYDSILENNEKHS